MNADHVIFNSVFPLWLVTVAALALTVFFVWKEIQRKHRYLTIRIITQLIIVLSVTALIVRPSLKREKTIGSALLLTKNYNRAQADSLVAKYGVRVLRAFDADAYPRSQKISSWHLLQEDAKDIRFVLGEGIPSSALEEYDLHFDYVNTKIPQGITAIQLAPLKKDQLNTIQGKINYHKPALVKLSGPAGTEDSVILKDNTTSFALCTLPKQEGRFIYQLDLVDNGKIIESNALPIEVLPEQKLNMLFVQQFPTFETRYLKNYLGEKGHSITLRYQVSKNIYRYEYANRDKQLLPQLTASALEEIDLLFITPEALSELSAKEMQTLESSIKDGLGMILLFSKPVKNIQRFFPYDLKQVTNDTVTLSSTQWKEKLTFAAAPWRVAPLPAIQQVFSDKNQQLLSGYFYQGMGVTAFQFLSETFHLALEGKASEYASIWSPLIEHAARKQPHPFRIQITSPFPYAVNAPVHFEVIAAAETPQLYYDSIRIPLKEDVSIDQLWHGTVWANETGWHQFSLQDSTRLQFYVSDQAEWNSLRLSNQQQQNRMHTAALNSTSSHITEYEPVSPLLFFLLFVLASGTLWLVAKL